MIKEFKEFALKGNFFDMAVGIVIGASFSTIVKSLVDDIIMPIVGAFSGGIDFKEKFISLGGDFETLAAAKEAGASVITYGNFVSAIITFIIVAFVLFLIVKGMNKAMEQMKEEEAAAPAAPSAEVTLLTEIRDSLKK